jgi:hypothetical protein
VTGGRTSGWGRTGATATTTGRAGAAGGSATFRAGAGVSGVFAAGVSAWRDGSGVACGASMGGVVTLPTRTTAAGGVLDGASTP